MSPRQPSPLDKMNHVDKKYASTYKYNCIFKQSIKHIYPYSIAVTTTHPHFGTKGWHLAKKQNVR